MTDKDIINWLLEGDVSIQYLTQRDLLDKDRKDLKVRISQEGWGKNLLDLQNPNGHWGKGYYQPKWTSTHYTMLDLRYLETPLTGGIQKAIDLIMEFERGQDGGVHPSHSAGNSDVCMNGMVMNFACFYGYPEDKLRRVVDFILSQKMRDGGFNCRLNRSGAVHSSLHSTTSVIEGIQEYLKAGYQYRKDELEEAAATSREFILKHRFFLSDRTGKIIRNEFLRLSFPWRWRYNILKALVYFVNEGVAFDERMIPALEILIHKRRKDNRWNMQAQHPGQFHFLMEKAGSPSRWNTLLAMRVLNTYDIN